MSSSTEKSSDKTKGNVSIPSQVSSSTLLTGNMPPNDSDEGNREVKSQPDEEVEQSLTSSRASSSPTTTFGPREASVFCTTLFSAGSASLQPLFDETNQRTEDQVKNPHSSLFNELVLNLDGSVMIYAYTALRHLAHEGKIENAEAVLKLPITTSDTLDYMTRNAALIKEKLGKSKQGLFERAMDDVEKRMEEASTVQGVTYKELEERGQLGFFDFGDLHQKEECVYAVHVNGIARRVSVFFRGSVTEKDWSTDLKMSLRRLPTDICGEKFRGAQVHSGFYEYLFTDMTKAHKNGSNLDVENGAKTKFEAILFSVIRLLKCNPGFKLYVTGHSLGGALAQIFATRVAALDDPNIPKPVICFTYASPRVGNMMFRGWCQELEREGKLRNMRVVNQMDMIPHAPTKGCLRIFFVLFAPSMLYRHVGLQLKLLERKRGFEISYAQFRSGWALLWFDLLSTIKRFFYGLLFWTFMFPNEMRYHSCNEHFHRLMDNCDALKGLSMDDFYEEIQSRSELFYKYGHDSK